MAEYELSQAENRRVQRLHQRLLWASISLVTLGVVMGVSAHFRATGEQLWVQLIAALFFVALGIVFWRPLDNLKRITTTQGSDITELMIAMKDLRVAFSTGAVLFGILAVLTASGIARVVTM